MDVPTSGFIDCKTGKDLTFEQVDAMFPQDGSKPKAGACIANLHTTCGVPFLRDVPLINAIPGVGRDCVTPEKAPALLMSNVPNIIPEQ